jgi:RNA polymerase sigma-70 factor (ECF subfamily)
MEHLDIEKQFKTVYDAEADSAFRYCLFRVSSRSQAIDIVQDVFIELWQTYQSGQVIKNARALLFTILRNRIIDWYRKKKSLSLDGMMAKNGEYGYEPTDDKAYDSIMFGAETLGVIQAINDLMPNYRDVVYLRLVEDRTPEEIAAVMKTNANVVSIRITRGLEKLRKNLKIKKPL